MHGRVRGVPWLLFLMVLSLTLLVYEIEIEIYPLQKGVLKDIISPVGCNGPVVMGVCMGGLSGTSILCDSYHIMEMLSGLGVDKGW